MILTKEKVLDDIRALPENYKTKDIDRLISAYVREKSDASLLRDHILRETKLHRIYFFVSLKQIKSPSDRLRFIDENLLFEDWWHTDQIINFVSRADFEEAFSYAKKYTKAEDPFIRRWGYVMFISRLCLSHEAKLLSLLHKDDHYYVQMAEAWLLAELAVTEPQIVFESLKTAGLGYNISGKAIQKICDSFRISDEWKEDFKSLRPALRSSE